VSVRDSNFDRKGFLNEFTSITITLAQFRWISARVGQQPKQLVINQSEQTPLTLITKEAP